MKTAFPITVTEAGVSARIRRVKQRKKGITYHSFVVEYWLLGKRKQEWRASLDEAKTAASDACKKIANGEQLALELKNGDRLAYLRASEALAALNVPIDTACQEYRDAVAVLGGLASIVEAARFFRKTHETKLPTVAVSAAVDEMVAQAKRDGKSKQRIHQLETYLNRLKQSFNCNVSDLTPKLISDFIVAMPIKERTKKNCRDILKAFSRWLVGRGYLPKDRDLMEGVQRYGNRKIGAIQIFTPDELKKLVAAARAEVLPYFLIEAFAGIRGMEIQRLDWADIDLDDGWIEVAGEKSKTDVRRLVPVKPNLKAWLLPLAKKSGPVCALKNMANEVNDLSKASGVTWKKNGLRHSYISYRVAECADVPRVADEAGNSPSVIRTNYLRRVKPEQAKQWFSILKTEPTPAPENNVVNLCATQMQDAAAA